MHEWLERVRALGPAFDDEQRGADLVAEAAATTTRSSAGEHGCGGRRGRRRPHWRLPPANKVREELWTATSISAPSHLDAEVLSALGRRSRSGELRDPHERIAALADFSATRWPLRAPAWALINRIAVRDALYVALALSLDATLVTTDDRLRKAASGLVAVADFDATR